MAELQKLKSKELQYTEISFTIGNYHELVKNPKKTKKGNELNKHLWIAFVEYSPDKRLTFRFIDKVKFGFHESFGFDHKLVKSTFGKRVQWQQIGWGYFDMPITVYFKKETGLKPLEIEHELCFDGNGLWKKYKVKIEK